MAKTTKASEEAEDTSAIAETAKAELAAPAAGTLQIDPEDIDIPRINIVQKQSNIDGDVGAILLDKTHTLAQKDEPLEVVVVSARKGWREVIPYDDDEMPRIVWTKEQADAIADDSDYTMMEFADITLLIKKPEDCVDEEAFAFPIGENDYAMGRINVAKNAFRTTYKRIATFAAFNPNVPLCGRVWNYKSELMEKGKYSWFNQSLSITKQEADSSVMEFLKSFGA